MGWGIQNGGDVLGERREAHFWQAPAQFSYKMGGQGPMRGGRTHCNFLAAAFAAASSFALSALVFLGIGWIRKGNGNGEYIPGPFPSLLVLLLFFPNPPSLPLLLYYVLIVLFALGAFACLLICIRSLALGYGRIASLEAAASSGDI